MKDNWEELVQVASGYLELGMLEDAERALEKIASEDRKSKKGEAILLQIRTSPVPAGILVLIWLVMLALRRHGGSKAASP